MVLYDLNFILFFYVVIISNKYSLKVCMKDHSFKIKSQKREQVKIQ